MKNKKNMKKIKAAAAISAIVLATFIVVSGPALIADTTPPLNTYKSEVTVTLTASDDSSGVQYINYIIVLDGTIIEEQQVFNETITFVCTAPGDYTIRYYAVDWAGNVEAEKTRSFTILFDTIPPNTEITLDGDLL